MNTRFLLVLLLLLSSCDKPEVSNKPTKKETPLTLEGEAYNVSRFKQFKKQVSNKTIEEQGNKSRAAATIDSLIEVTFAEKDSIINK